MASNPSIPKIKILFLGDSGVGKSALLRQFLEGRFARTTATVGFDLEFKVMEIQNRQVKLEIWDTAGQEAFRAIVPSHYRRSKGVILVYDVTKPKTLENLQKWVDQLNAYVDSSPPMIVVGNKIDLLPSATEGGQDVDALGQGLEFADRIGAFKHTNTSAKNGAGVKEVFEDLVYEIVFNAYAEKVEEETQPRAEGVNLNDDKGPGQRQTRAGRCWC